MNKQYVFDSYAFFVLFNKEPSYKKIHNIFKKARENNKPVLFSYINYGEIYYILIRELGLKKAKKQLIYIHNLPIKLIKPNLELTRLAAEFKAVGGISYADCFALALTSQSKSILLTGDKEFKRFNKKVKIEWI